MKNIYDIENRIFGSCSISSKSPSQRRIRKILRNEGYGVGKGNRYEIDEADFELTVDLVKQRIQNFQD